MGFLNFFQKPNPESEAGQTLLKLAFPGGPDEIKFKARVVYQLAGGKFDEQESAQVLTKTKTRFLLRKVKFDGDKHLGINADELVERCGQDSNQKLTILEAASICWYAVTNTTDALPVDHLPMLRQMLSGLFGSDDIGSDADVIPTGLGDFGFQATNPIPVRGIAGIGFYLNRLRMDDGRPIAHQRQRAVGVHGIENPIDEYQISLGGKPVATLYISPYHRRISAQAPLGFRLERIPDNDQ